MWRLLPEELEEMGEYLDPEDDDEQQADVEDDEADHFARAPKRLRELRHE